MNTADNSPSQPSSPPSAAKKAKPTKSGFNFTAALKPAAKVAEQKDAAQEAQASTKPKVAEGSAGDTSTVKPETAASSNGSASMPAQPQPSMSMESPEPSTVPSVVFGQPPLPSDGTMPDGARAADAAPPTFHIGSGGGGMKSKAKTKKPAIRTPPMGSPIRQKGTAAAAEGKPMPAPPPFMPDPSSSPTSQGSAAADTSSQ
ncbi:hypothetical protein CYMTET_23439, partial [Cymbomonas tetramitiformis]